MDESSSRKRRAIGSASPPRSRECSPDRDVSLRCARARHLEAPTMIRNLSVRLSSLFGREQQERELDAELKYHVDMLTEQNVQKGMSRDAARREALRLFGPVEGVKDDVRDKWLSRFAEVAAQDVRY